MGMSFKLATISWCPGELPLAFLITFVLQVLWQLPFYVSLGCDYVGVGVFWWLQIFWSEFELIPNTSASKKFVPDLFNDESSSCSDELTGLRQWDAELVCYGNKEVSVSDKTSRSYLVPALPSPECRCNRLGFSWFETSIPADEDEDIICNIFIKNKFELVKRFCWVKRLTYGGGPGHRFLM